METRKLSDIIEDLRAAANDDSLDSIILHKEVDMRASELEAILAKEKSDGKFAVIVSILFMLFSVAFAVITYMNNDDLREDVTQKKEIITKYEKAVSRDTIHTYIDEDGKEITVPSLLDDNLKLMNKIHDLEFRLDLYEMKLRSIETQYGIKVVNDKNLYHLEGKKVDSALLLLPVFRDKMSYDSIKRQWTISVDTKR